VVVVGVLCVVEVAVVGATLWLEVDAEDPHALTSRVSRTAAIGMRRCLMVVSRPLDVWLAMKDAAGCSLVPALDEDLNNP